jgi:hypothetical protein
MAADAHLESCTLTATSHELSLSTDVGIQHYISKKS